MRQARVNEHEFCGEERSGEKSRAQRAVAQEERMAAQARPGEEQRRGDDRAQRRLHHQRDIASDRLHCDLLESPQRSEQKHHADRNAVDRISLLTHRADFGVT